MHAPEEYFWNALGDHNIIHVLAAVRIDFDPADIECEEYRAVIILKEKVSATLVIGGILMAIGQS